PAEPAQGKAATPGETLVALAVAAARLAVVKGWAQQRQSAARALVATRHPSERSPDPGEV
ncbi:MAG TPA: hypothetical protein PK866_04765, partial [Nitrospira sp.]|nr:hypothetical protein [Nitrospira sp.]